MTCVLCLAAAICGQVSVVDRPDPSGGISHYAANRAPLEPSPLVKPPIGAVRPAGWIKRILELQADGFHGRLTEISRFLKKENNAWLSREGVGDHGWEEVPYWLKGFIGCAYLLENDRMIKEARIWIEGMLNSRKEDGWFGPDKGRGGVATDLKGRDDLWPNMIALFCLQAYYERAGDKRVIDLMTGYFKYLSGVPEERFLVGYWPPMRGGDQLYSILWLYNVTGEAWLLDLAHKTHRRSARWDRDVINWHNVNIAQGFREPATYWQLSRDPAHLEATERVWSKVRRMYGQVPGGMFGADENARPGHNGPRQAIETCGIAEEMLSDEILIAVTGDPAWAERCEEAAYNSMPASMTADMKALRYLTAPNQPQSDHANKAPAVQNGGGMFHMNPHSHRCCQHNAGHAWPYFAQHLWYAAAGNGLAAYLYGPCEVRAKVGDGAEARIVETTSYPFDERVDLAVTMDRPARFPLYLRVPSWCQNARLSVNGKDEPAGLAAGKLAKIDREWKSGDQVILHLPMAVRLKIWKENRGTVSVSRGPLTYSLQIKEEYRRHGGTDAWPAWDIFPASPWNYGLVLEGGRPEASIKVLQGQWPRDDQPWKAEASPVRLSARAKRIPNWTLDARGAVNEVVQGPIRSAEKEERVTLVPMGAARLRISAFPVIGEGPDAKDWPEPPRPAYKASASHCFESDTVEALADGLVPRNSNDRGIPRFTWWPRKGGTEWVEAAFDKPRKISSVKVYWFDDTPGGGCGVPASWRLLYREGEAWKPVSGAGPFGVEKDRFNSVTFDPVATSALRIEAQLRPNLSGGILEWTVE